ncbi:hypothetical protein RFI_07053 [Reticulomyxa filosa]|uniref:Uncharacterized protein n=1 Tax=Reticulomyxa filosa TaxID=46433 RepID=X6NVM5_RETFI|nr:hypothetical protein RFI_07053 [Reticulomyxa filosa]|eukprot:ETO30066.1 hypothetical protein RFI_07053 [Reticulomyxa filosa]
MKMINLITKYTLLVFCSHTIVIPVVILMILRWKTQPDTTGVEYHIHLMLMSLDVVVNLICLDFSFGFTNNAYDQFFGCCHVFIQAKIANLTLEQLYGDVIKTDRYAANEITSTSQVLPVVPSNIAQPHP